MRPNKAETAVHGCHSTGQNRLCACVRYCFCHSKIKFISSRHRVISSIQHQKPIQLHARSLVQNAVYILLRGKSLNYNMVPMDDFNHHILGSLFPYSGFSFWSHLFYWRLPSFSVVTTIFGKSRDDNTIPLKTHTAFIFLC